MNKPKRNMKIKYDCGGLYNTGKCTLTKVEGKMYGLLLDNTETCINKPSCSLKLKTKGLRRKRRIREDGSCLERTHGNRGISHKSWHGSECEDYDW